MDRRQPASDIAVAHDRWAPTCASDRNRTRDLAATVLRHDTSDYVRAARGAGFALAHLGEWRDAEAGPQDPPRLSPCGFAGAGARPGRAEGDGAMRHRHATADDAAAIAGLHADSWRVAYRGALRDAFLDGDVVSERTRVWRDRLSAPPGSQLVVVAEDDGGLVGFACAYGGDDARWGTLLDNLHVRREIHRRGTGRRLLAEVARWCGSRDPEAGLYCWVVEDNGPARLFYERLGATDRDGDVWVPPGGGLVRRRRYAWSSDALVVLGRVA